MLSSNTYRGLRNSQSERRPCPVRPPSPEHDSLCESAARPAPIRAQRRWASALSSRRSEGRLQLPHTAKTKLLHRSAGRWLSELCERSRRGRQPPYTAAHRLSNTAHFKRRRPSAMTAPGILPAQRCHRLQHSLGGLWSLRCLIPPPIASRTLLPPGSRANASGRLGLSQNILSVSGSLPPFQWGRLQQAHRRNTTPFPRA